MDPRFFIAVIAVAAVVLGVQWLMDVLVRSGMLPWIGVSAAGVFGGSFYLSRQVILSLVFGAIAAFVFVLFIVNSALSQ